MPRSVADIGPVKIQEEVVTVDDLAEVHRALYATHHEELDDPRNEAEGLDRASCPPHVKHLAQLAAGASLGRKSAEEWRTWVLADAGDHAAALIESAEECMRASGLWPWPT